MLNIINITTERYNALSQEEKAQPNTIFLCRDTTTERCSIYTNGRCYGEDIDEDHILSRLSSVEEQLDNFEIATNSDILDILQR